MTLEDLIAGFRAVATASVSDAVDSVTGKRGYMDAAIKPRINDQKIADPAVTITAVATTEFLPPQLALDAIDDSPAGSVICISVEGDENVAVWGGLMTAGARANKHEAAVLDGAVRDITEIRRDYDFPVFARAASPGTSLGRYMTVAMNEPALIGGITVHPGEIIVGDVEGVVVVPHAQAAEVLAMAREIDQRELEQATLIVASGSLRGGLAKYGRI